MASGISYLESLGVRVFMDASNFFNTAAAVQRQNIILANASAQAAGAASIAQATAIRAATAAAIIPMTALTAFGIKEFAKLDDAVHKSLATMADYDKTLYSTITHTSLAIAGKSGVASPDKIAAVFGEMAHAGYSVAESMKLMSTVQQTSVVGNMDLVKSGQLLATVQTNLGMSTDDSAESMKNFMKVADIAARGSQIARTSMESFLESMANPKLGATARSHRMSIEEVGSMVLAFSQMGVTSRNAGRSGVGMASLYRELNTAATKTAPAAWERFLGKDNLFDGKGQMKNGADLLNLLSSRMKNMSDVQRGVMMSTLGFTRVSDILAQTLLNVDNKGTSAAGMIAFFNTQLLGADGTLKKMYNVRMQSFLMVMDQLWTKVKVVAIVFASVLAPALELAAKAIDKIIGAFTRLPVGLQQMLAGAAGVAMFAVIIHWVFLLAGAIKGLGAVGFLTGGVMGVLNLSMTALFFKLPGLGTMLLATSTAMKGFAVATWAALTGTGGLSGILAVLTTSLGSFMAVLGAIGAPLLILGGVLAALGATGNLGVVWDSAKVGFKGLFGLMYNFSENWKILNEFMGDSWVKTLWHMFQELSHFITSAVALWGVSWKMAFEDWMDQFGVTFGGQKRYMVHRDAQGHEILTRPPETLGEKLGLFKPQADLLPPRSHEKQRLLDLDVLNRLQRPFEGMNVIGLPKFNTDLGPAGVKGLFDKINPFKSLMDENLGDIMGGAAGKHRDFTELHPARFMIDHMHETTESQEGWLQKIDAKLERIATGIEKNRVPQADGGMTGHAGHTGAGGNPAHVHFGKLPIKVKP